MERSCTFYIVRHGQTDWNVKKLIQGQKDIPLNETGELQAKILGEKLKDIKFDAVYSSDLIRAKRTAEIITIEKKLAIATTKALRERHFGKFQGLSFASDKNTSIMKLVNELKAASPQDQKEIENDEFMISRLITFLREVAVVSPNKTILIVTHAGPIRTLLIHLGWAKYENFTEGGIKNLAYIKLESDGVDFFVRETEGITSSRPTRSGGGWE